jgi:electron transport complex protein RnfB
VSEATVEQIDALLPQTQCAKCGYPGCRPYAEAIARGQAEINGCPPGGETALRNLAALLGRDLQGLALPPGAEQPRAAAFIREDLCIGCTLCIPACPVDAIVGARKQMHTVLSAGCTGCELCAPACPVDCIDMLPLTELAQRGSRVAASEQHIPVAAHAQRWRRRYEVHLLRLARSREERDARRAAKPGAGSRAAAVPGAAERLERKRAAVRAALERARSRRAP